MNYQESLKNLSATLKAQEIFRRTVKDDAVSTYDTYDLYIAKAAAEFVKAYKNFKNPGESESTNFDS